MYAKKKKEKTYLHIQRLQFETIVLFLHYTRSIFYIFMYLICGSIEQTPSHNHYVSKAKI